ncbi:MAG: hypothetical protein ABEJ76_01930 [Halanaeroarchaeum sp.]
MSEGEISTDRVESYRDALDAIPPIEESREGDRLRVTRAFRGMHLEQAIGYLEALGGRRVGDNAVEGPGWNATLSETVVPVGPSYRLTQVTIEWEGESDALEPVILRFRVKAFRAPG